mmetsp:Transcript_65371/g.121866  ORF Transcript_65371/g.121866 Transcript_65371/m.121866 type:complete len:400 (+) Transcript_65371:1079-2278(+)
MRFGMDPEDMPCKEECTPASCERFSCIGCKICGGPHDVPGAVSATEAPAPVTAAPTPAPDTEAPAPAGSSDGGYSSDKPCISALCKTEEDCGIFGYSCSGCKLCGGTQEPSGTYPANGAVTEASGSESGVRASTSIAPSDDNVLDALRFGMSPEELPCAEGICEKKEDCSVFRFSCLGCKICGGTKDPGQKVPVTKAPTPAKTTRRWTTPKPTRRTTTLSVRRHNLPLWLQEVEVVSVKAQAYVAHALQQAPRATALLEKWFGRSDSKTLEKVMYVLNSVSGMLGNVAYKNGGRGCSSNTYAYVYPYGNLAKNRQGEFVFYLCGVYFASDLGEKIETLTHEGSHHAIAHTDDVWADKSRDIKAYGRSTCKQLAREHPDRAIRNADNHCYFINDINGHSR